MLNQVTLIGRTTKDAKLSTSANGKEYTFVTLAIDGIPGKDGQKTTDFISVSLFGSSAKFASEYCHKGDILQVTGRLTSRIQEKDGQKTTVLSVTGNRVENLSPRSSNGGTKTETKQAPAPAKDDGYDPFEGEPISAEDAGLITSDDLPF